MKIGFGYSAMTIESSEVVLICRSKNENQYEMHFKNGTTVVMDCTDVCERDFELERLMRSISESVDETIPD